MTKTHIGARYQWPNETYIYEVTHYDSDKDKWLVVRLGTNWSDWFGSKWFQDLEPYRLPEDPADPTPVSDAVTADYVTAQATKIIEAPEDVVNHPSHYRFANGVEVIALTEQLNFNCGNVVKYTARAGRKDASKQLEDLRKAEFYIKREIARVENLGEDL